MKQYIISETQVKAIGDYLASKPFMEVEQGIAILRNLKEYKEPEVKEEQEDNPE